MKIIIVGPIYPYKGGIAHHTGLLAANLSKEYDVEVISFKMLYPSFLYKKTQKDYENNAFEYKNIKYLINTVNPISYIKTGRYIKKQKPDLIIFQWWHPYFAPAYWTILKVIKKIKVIFICHNVLPHEKFPFQKKITKTVLSKGGQIVHSDTEANELINLIKTPIYAQTVLPIFDLFSKICNYQKKDARNHLLLNESDRVLLFFGFIREYKGLKHLIKAMPDIIKQYPECILLIVGDYFEGNKEEYLLLIDDIEMQKNIKIFDGYIPDSEVGLYFSACDIVVLPYESATQSGIVQIAYGFNKPVIATKVGGLPDVVVDKKTGYLIPPCDSRAVTEAVKQFFEKGDINFFNENIITEKYKYSWDRMTEIILVLYNKLQLGR